MIYCSPSNKSFTFSFENRKNIASIALSPDSNVFLSIDEGACLANRFWLDSDVCRWPCSTRKFQTWSSSSPLQLQKARKGSQVLSRWKVSITQRLFRIPQQQMHRYIAVTHDAHVQVWRTPNHLAREFAPFTLHRTYTGHHDEVLSIQWSSDSG